MAFVPALGVAQVELRMLLDSQKVENVLYFYLGANPSDSDFVTLGNDLIAWWKGHIAPLTSQNVSLNEVYITDLSSSTSPTFSVTATLPYDGAKTSAALPNSNTITVSFRTNGRGRSSRGRNYFIGLCEDQVTNNQVSSTVTDTLVTAYKLLINGEGTLTRGDWVVLSRTHNKAPRTQGLHQEITNVVVVDRTVDSQRRRLPGRGV